MQNLREGSGEILEASGMAVSVPAYDLKDVQTTLDAKAGLPNERGSFATPEFQINNKEYTAKAPSDGKPSHARTRLKILYRVDHVDPRGELLASNTSEESSVVLPFDNKDRPVLKMVTTVVSIPRSESRATMANSQTTPDPTPKAQRGFDPSIIKNAHAIIHSIPLLNALKAVVKYYPGENLIGQVMFNEPYHLLFHHRAELEPYKSQHPEWHADEYRAECNEHIDVLLEFINERFGKAIKDEENRYARTPAVCTFEYLWLLLRPGERCYYKLDTGEMSTYITQQIASSRIQGRPSAHRVIAWNIQFDGSQVGRVDLRIPIAPFDGEKEIRSLDYYPERFHARTPEESAANSKMNERFLARGKQFWDIIKQPTHMSYDGKAARYPFQMIRYFTLAPKPDLVINHCSSVLYNCGNHERYLGISPQNYIFDTL